MNLSWSVTVEWLQFLGTIAAVVVLLVVLVAIVYAAVAIDRDAGNLEP